MDFYDNYINRREFVCHLVKFDKDQLFEINLGHLSGLTVDQICLYARPEFNSMVMRHLKQAMIEQLDIEKVKFMANPKFEYPQMILIKNAFDSGLSLEEVKSFATPDRSYGEMYSEYYKILDSRV
jgi:hypothetical protein